ncbi:MAG: protein kinase, partial [Acidobacteriota bacterium]
GTKTGVILGTAAYMSPEQARGQPLDRRTDIWSFGCVMYEMLTGRRAFAGETISDIIAQVLKAEPDWALLPKGLPAGVRRVLTRCLQKDPDRRLRDLGDAEVEIQEARRDEEAGSEAARAEAGGRSRSWTRAATAAGLLAAALAGAMVGWMASTGRTSEPLSSPTSLRMVLPDETPLAAGSFLCPVAFSPDGRLLAYVGVNDGVRRLYLRDLGRLEVTAVPGTEGAEGPFFAPDGQWVGFHADGKLRKVSVHGGLPQNLLDLVDFRGATWGPDDTIVFAPGQAVPLFRIPASGGTPQQLTRLDAAKGEWSHRFPQFLPDGETVIFSAHEGDFDVNEAELWAVSLRTGERKFLMEASTDVRFVPTGHLLFVQAGTLLAVPFDTGRLEVTGSARPMVQKVAVQTNTGAAAFAVSPGGNLLYSIGDLIGDQVQLVWVDRSGVTEPFAAGNTVYRWPRLSPDGEHMTIQIIGANMQGIWMTPTDHVGFSRVAEDGVAPVWSPEGRWLVFADSSGTKIYRKLSDGSGSEELLAEGDLPAIPSSVSPDGSMIAFTQVDPETKRDIWLLPVAEDARARPFLNTPAREGGARFSPDGEHLVYVSDESGRFEVYVTAYPDPGGKWQVSTDGGREPLWSRDGTELFFRDGDNLMVVSVETDPVFRSGPPRIVFKGIYEGLLGSIDWPNYDVAPDGRLLMVKSPELEATRAQVHLILDWFRQLEQPT